MSNVCHGVLFSSSYKFPSTDSHVVTGILILLVCEYLMVKKLDRRNIAYVSFDFSNLNDG